ncbi:MAG: MGH1-like glycoside hydrolase domain-containing protein [Opitutales bacterium]
MRLQTGRAAAFVGKPISLLHYAFELIIWSRIVAGRLRWTPIELPLETLRGKGVHRPPPRLELRAHPDAEVFNEGFAEIHALLFANLNKPGALSRQRHAVPGPAFRGVYLWDSAFIAQIWKHWDPQVAAEVLGAVLELRAGQRLVHVVSHFMRSRYTQPPLIAWSFVELGRTLAPAARRELYERIYPPLRAYHQWLRGNRQLPNGLFFWAHPYESGVENAPRFSNRDESVLADTRRWGSPDFCTYVVLQLEALAAMARTLEKPAEARDFDVRADHLRERVNALLWDETDGLYYDLDTLTGKPVRSITIASLLPLWAGIPGERQTQRLVEWIQRPDAFATLLPLPSVALCDPAFEPDMWRGPVWLNTAYGVLQGLLRAGYETLAGEYAWHLCRGVYGVFNTERRVYEFYDPLALHTASLERKKGNRWKAFTLGTGPQRDFVGWTGLVNTLVIEVLCGWTREDDEDRLRPRLPPPTRDSTWHLQLAEDHHLTLHHAPDDTFSGELCRGGERQPFRLQRGEEASFPLTGNSPAEPAPLPSLR